MIAAMSRVWGPFASSIGMAFFLPTFFVVLETEEPASESVGYGYAFYISTYYIITSNGSSGKGTSSAFLFFLGDLDFLCLFDFLLLTVSVSYSDSTAGGFSKSFEILGADVVNRGSRFRPFFLRMLRFAYALWFFNSSASISFSSAYAS